MKNIKEYKGIIIIVLVLILGVFYWYEYRPQRAIKYCYGYASMTNNPDSIFKECLLSKGFIK